LRRNRIDIITDILSIAEEETLKTPILTQANLSFQQLDAYLDFLFKMNLLTSYERDGQTFFKTTKKGYNFLEAYQEIQNLPSLQCSNCGICCQETMMELSSDDIERLEKAGFLLEEFVIVNEEGACLRNVDGHCCFYSSSDKKCKIYEKRPLGCYIYPVIYGPKKGAIVDKLCPRGYMITEQELREKEKILTELLKKIDNERVAYQKGVSCSYSTQMDSAHAFRKSQTT